MSETEALSPRLCSNWRPRQGLFFLGNYRQKIGNLAMAYQDALNMAFLGISQGISNPISVANRRFSAGLLRGLKARRKQQFATGSI